MAGLLAPMVSGVVQLDQSQDGPMTIDVTLRPGLVQLLLEANNTSLTLAGEPEPGQMQLFVLSVSQGGAGSFTWTAPTNVAWSGGTPGMAATIPGHADVYTLTWDGDQWIESGRALDVYVGV
jgi:hypothetical protein